MSLINSIIVFLSPKTDISFYPMFFWCYLSVVIVKNPGPKGPALISPQRGGACYSSSNGMMEWWNNGILGIKNGPPQAD